MKDQIRNACIIAALSVLCIIIVSGGKKEMHTISLYDVFDTYCEISVSGKNSEKALADCRELLEKYHAMWNVNDPDSEISKLNDNAGKESVALSADTIDILDRSKKYSLETNGFFDITVGAAAKLWNIPNEPRVPTKEELAEVIHKTGSELLEVDSDHAFLKKEGASITLGAIAKGYATEKLAEILKQNKINSALINLGGNVYALGSGTDGRLWNVGIADPRNDGETIGSIEVSNKAVITSAGNYRYFEENGVRYSHILNPFTASPANSGLLSVTVISANPTDADVLSTACYVIGYQQSVPLLNEYNADAVFVTENGTVYYTGGIADSFKYENTNYEYKLIK